MPVLILALAAPAVARAAASADSVESLRLPEGRFHAWQTGLLRTDRMQHASLAFTLGLGAGLASREPAAAFAAPALLGFGKEIADRKDTGFDLTDLLADLIGAGAAAWIVDRWDP